MSFAELLEEVKNLSPSEKAALRSLLSEDLLNQEESEELLAQLDADVAAADAGNSVYTIEETREMVRNVVARARR
jgi:succinate dehydrogenase flavin-adding protein (antitoxin of CptAB toxin-antitoxin module)